MLCPPAAGSSAWSEARRSISRHHVGRQKCRKDHVCHSNPTHVCCKVGVFWGRLPIDHLHPVPCVLSEAKNVDTASCDFNCDCPVARLSSMIGVACGREAVSEDLKSRSNLACEIMQVLLLLLETFLHIVLSLLALHEFPLAPAAHFIRLLTGL